MSQQTTECKNIIMLALNHSNSQPDTKHPSENHLHSSLSSSNTTSLRSIPSIVTPAALDKDGLKIRLSRDNSCSEIRITKQSFSEQEIQGFSQQKPCNDNHFPEEINIFAKKPNTISSSSLFPSKSTQSGGVSNPPTQKNQGFRQYSKITNNNILIPTTVVAASLSPSPLHKKSDSLIDLFLEIASEGLLIAKQNTPLAQGQNTSSSPSCSQANILSSNEGKKRKYKVSLDVDGEEIISKKLKMNSCDSKSGNDLKQYQNAQKKYGKKESLKKEAEKPFQRNNNLFQSQFQTPNKGDRIESVVKQGKELIFHLTNNDSPLFSLQRRIAKFSFLKEIEEDKSIAKLELERLKRSIIFNSLDTFQAKIETEDKDFERDDDIQNRGNHTTEKKIPSSREDTADISAFDKAYEQATERKYSNCNNEGDKSKSVLEKFEQLRNRFRIVKSTFKSSILLN